MLALMVGCHSAKPEAQPAADPCRPPTGSLPRRRPPRVSRGNTAFTSPLRRARARAGQSRRASTLAARGFARARRRGPGGARHHDEPSAGRPDRPRPDRARWRADRRHTSTDPTAPGVLVIERHPAPRVRRRDHAAARVRANRRGVVRFDGGYFALTVRASSRWFRGHLVECGTSRVRADGGYFCAERRRPGDPDPRRSRAEDSANGTRGDCRGSRSRAVEAQGIEPWSE